MALITLGANSGKGKILQVVSAFTDTDVALSANTLTDTTLTATITPSSASNKILVNILQAIGKQSSAVAYQSILRNRSLYRKAESR